MRLLKLTRRLNSCFS